MNLEEIKTSWEKDAKINENNIALESIKCSSLHAKYIGEIASHKSREIKLKSEYSKVKKIKVKYFNGEMSKEELEEYQLEQYQGKRMLKTQMDEFLAGDEDLLLILNKLDYTKTCIYVLEGIIKSIYGRSYDVRNFVESRKFELGY